MPAASTPAQPDTGATPNKPRILRLRLLTVAPLEAMRRFYRDIIGFRVLEEKEGEISFAAGATRLTFLSAKPEQVRGDGGRGHGEPFYHFAFNIPQDKIQAARAWQLERAALINPSPGLLDPAYPNDVWHFRHWNAHSIFFWDPGFNIVEYIARHDLRNEPALGNGFAAADILYVSEIGYVFDAPQLPQATRMLHEKLGLEAYPRGSDPWAMGDERGLLLCLARKGELWGENTLTPVKWDVFPTDAVVRGSEPGVHEFEGFPYRVRVE